MVESFYYQEIYVGDINVITEYMKEGEEIIMISDDDCLIERDEKGNEHEIDEEHNELVFEKDLTVNKHDGLSISDTKNLKSGYMI